MTDSVIANFLTRIQKNALDPPFPIPKCQKEHPSLACVADSLFTVQRRTIPIVGLLDTWANCNAGCSSQESGFRGLGLRIRVSVDLSGVNNLERLVHCHYKQSIIINCSLCSRPAGLLARVKLWRYIHLCEFCEKVRQYCINKFVRTILLSKNIILFENNTYIIVKKIGAKNSTRKQ